MKKAGCTFPSQRPFPSCTQRGGPHHQAGGFGSGWMKVLYDTKLMRPGCVLMAAVFSANTHAPQKFDTRDWLLSPTPDMKVYETTPEQLTQLVKMTEQHRAKCA